MLGMSIYFNYKLVFTIVDQLYDLFEDIAIASAVINS